MFGRYIMMCDTGKQHHGEVQHNCHADSECHGWGRPVPTFPSLHISLSRRDHPSVHQPRLHSQHHRQRGGKQCLQIKIHPITLAVEKWLLAV